jgi:hypothetical protein
MTEGGGKQRLNGETITGVALVFLGLLFIWAAMQNTVWASIVLAAYVIIALGVGFIVVGAVTIHRTNNPRSESKSRY